MIIECECGSPVLIVGTLQPGTTCPDCQAPINNLPKPVKQPLDALPRRRWTTKPLGRPKGSKAIIEPPTWSELVAEIEYDTPYTFGQSDSTTISNTDLVANQGLSYNTHSWIWPEKQEREPVNRHQRPRFGYSNRIGKFKPRQCKDCGSRFRPVGPVDKRCPACKDVFQAKSRKKHVEACRLRRLAKAKCPV